MNADGNLPLSGERLWALLIGMARIGAPPNGGCDRQAPIDENGKARHPLRRWGEKGGLTLSADCLGNTAFRRDRSRPPVAIGSHFGTRSTGGKFDGVLGVFVLADAALATAGLA